MKKTQLLEVRTISEVKNMLDSINNRLGDLKTEQ